MRKVLEQPFEYLRKRDGSAFDAEVYENWYKARAFVLHALKDIAFKPDDETHLQVVVHGDDSLMLSVVRQVALSAHYINYDEDNEGSAKRNCTVITIVSNHPETVENELMKEEYLNNLVRYCNTVSFDIVWEVVSEWNGESGKNVIVKEIKKEDIESFCKSVPQNEIRYIDTRKAVYTSRMYELGRLIDSLPAENIHDARRYALALDTYQFELLRKKPDKLVNEDKWNENQAKVKGGLSNVFCSDCFELRANSIALCRKNKRQKENELWEENNEALSKSEHARWAVEKLVMGFRPFSKEERMKDEELAFDKKLRKQYRDGLKNNAEVMAHIDICSYADLRRINPEDMKYDSFLMLAIPAILKKVNQK